MIIFNENLLQSRIEQGENFLTSFIINAFRDSHLIKLLSFNISVYTEAATGSLRKGVLRNFANFIKNRDSGTGVFL